MCLSKSVTYPKHAMEYRSIYNNDISRSNDLLIDFSYLYIVMPIKPGWNQTVCGG